VAKSGYDIVVVGSGPNGLTAAAVLAAGGLSVLVLESKERIGGSCRTEPLTLDGFAHDVCSAIHPMGAISPIFRRLRLEKFGLEWVSPLAPAAHPLDDGRVALLERSVPETARTLEADGATWSRLMQPFVDRWEPLFAGILRPIRLPQHPWLMARFGLLALKSSDTLARRFTGAPARALFGGCAAHSILALDRAGSASFALAVALAAHAIDWPSAKGGSGRVTKALAAYATSKGCEIRTGVDVRSLEDLPPSRAVLFDVAPRQLDRIAGDALSSSYRARLRRFRHGPGAFKIDYALAEPIPWRSAACRRAGTVHLGGTYEEIARSESDASAGRISEAPLVLVAQQSLFDPTRAPEGRHTGWAYCHVPNGCDVDMTDRIERQIERFAPGFRDVVLARHVMPPAALEAHNPNLVGGDVGGGSNALWQVLARPFPRWDPYTTSNPRLYLCSASTPPGGGVHGMCGYWAARSVLRRTFQRAVPAELDLQ
jgi:phytoene dehydrogenase-like protein